MSPRTTQTVLATNDDIDTELLRSIANGLLTTITNRETDTAMQFHRFTERIKGLEDRILAGEDNSNLINTENPVAIIPANIANTK